MIVKTLIVRAVLLTAVVLGALWFAEEKPALQTSGNLAWSAGDAFVRFNQPFPPGLYWCVPFPQLEQLTVYAQRGEAYVFAGGPAVELCASGPGRWLATARSSSGMTSFYITVLPYRGNDAIQDSDAVL